MNEWRAKNWRGALTYIPLRVRQRGRWYFTSTHVLDSLAGLGKSTLRQLTWPRTATATATANWGQLTATCAWGRAEWKIFFGVFVGWLAKSRADDAWLDQFGLLVFGVRARRITVCHSDDGRTVPAVRLAQLHVFIRQSHPYPSRSLGPLRSLDRLPGDIADQRGRSDYSTAASVRA